MRMLRALLALMVAAVSLVACSDDEEAARGCDEEALHEALEASEEGIENLDIDDVDCVGDHAFGRVERPAGSGQYGFVTYFERTGDEWKGRVSGNDPPHSGEELGVPQDVWDSLEGTSDVAGAGTSLMSTDAGRTSR